MKLSNKNSEGDSDDDKRPPKARWIKREKRSGVKRFIMFLLLGVIGVCSASVTSQNDLQEPQYYQDEFILIDPSKVTIEPDLRLVRETITLDSSYKIKDFGVLAEPSVSYELIVEVTAYNSVEAQTDSTPCLAAGGYICGRNDVVACSRSIPLGTLIEIDNKLYVCLDRLANKYDNRVDIFMDKDVEGALRWGKQIKKIKVYGI